MKIKKRLIQILRLRLLSMKVMRKINRIRVNFLAFTSKWKAKILISLRLKNRKIVVTVFGSCRQDSLYKNFKVTKVRDGLTYPHYSKEILQAIRYCKGKIKDIDVFVFRNAQIGNPILKLNKLKKEIQKTDVFVIEISSANEYFIGDQYYHHVAGETGTINGIGVTKSLTTVDELERDLKAIRKELGENIIIVTHTAPDDGGKRTKLIKEIELLAERCDLVCFNPSELLAFWDPIRLFEAELSPAHFTNLGHRLVGGRLGLLILKLSKQEMLIQKYEAREKEGGYHGFGDYIFGCLKVYEEALKSGRVPSLDFSNHPINKYLHAFSAPTAEEPVNIWHTHKDSRFRKENVVFTNKRPILPPRIEAIDFVLRNTLTLNPSGQDALNKLKDKYGLQKGRYVVIHVRLGDEEFGDLSQVGNYSLMQKNLEKFVDRNFKGEKVLLLTDSSRLRDSMTDSSILNIAHEVGHSGIPEQADEVYLNMLLEFRVMMDAAHIVQTSAYSWGSAFSETAALLSGREVIRLPISDLLLH